MERPRPVLAPVNRTTGRSCIFSQSLLRPGRTVGYVSVQRGQVDQEPKPGRQERQVRRAAPLDRNFGALAVTRRLPRSKRYTVAPIRAMMPCPGCVEKPYVLAGSYRPAPERP
jgi:hypothetical protein